jgi:hypothetical protein
MNSPRRDGLNMCQYNILRAIPETHMSHFCIRALGVQWIGGRDLACNKSFKELRVKQG